jgi:hypothetical protein
MVLPGISSVVHRARVYGNKLTEKDVSLGFVVSVTVPIGILWRIRRCIDKEA